MTTTNDPPGINSIYPLICCSDLGRSLRFYRDVLGLEPVFEADWYVQFHAPGQPVAQLALILPDHDTIPERFRSVPAGVVISLEVDDADVRCAIARAAGAEIVIDTRSEVFGQRHFVTVDPDGLMVDVIQPIEPDAEWLAAQMS